MCEEPHESRHREVERFGPFPPHELVHRRRRLLGVEVAQVLGATGRFRARVHQLQGHRVIGEVQGGPQHLVTGDHGAYDLAERVEVEGRVVADPERRDVVVVVLPLVGEHLDDHAELQLRQRVGVDDGGRQLNPVVLGDQVERRDEPQ
ncbi:hypothetical protein GCM10022629_65740 [Amorphoplanes auranticolor]